MDSSVVLTRLNQCASPSNTCLLGPTRVHIPNGILIGLSVFAQLTAVSPYTLQWAAPFPSQNCPFAWGFWTHQIHGSFSSLQVFKSTTQTVPRLLQSFLQGSWLWQTDRQTDRPTDRQTGRPHNSIYNNRPQNIVRQCSLIIKLEMWANAQRDGRPAKYRWHPLFNAAKFGWRPLLDYHAVMLPRCKTRWNLLGCPKLANSSQPLLGRSSPYYEDMCRRYWCLASFFDCRYML